MAEEKEKVKEIKIDKVNHMEIIIYN